MRRIAVLFVVALAGVMASSWAHPVADAAGPRLRLGPDSGKVQGAAGTTLQLSVLMDEVTDFGGFDVEVHYDDSLVTVTDLQEGPALQQFATRTCVPSTLPGLVRYACSVSGGTLPLAGGWGLATIGFTLDQSFVGTLQFLLQGCEVVDSGGAPVALVGCDDSTIAASPVPPPAPMTMTPAVTKIQALAGSTLTIDVLIGNVIDLGGVEFNVTFDAGKLTLTNVTEGPFLANTPGTWTCFFLPPPTLFHNFGCVGTGKDAAATGSGVIAHVEFTVKAPFAGTTAVSLADCDAADIQGFPIPVNECGGATVQSNTPPPAVGGNSRDADAAGPATTTSPPPDATDVRDPALAVGVAALAGVGFWLALRRCRASNETGR